MSSTHEQHQLFEPLVGNLEQRKKTLLNETQYNLMETNNLHRTGVTLDEFNKPPTALLDFLVKDLPIDSEQGLTHLLHRFRKKKKSEKTE